jgi:hypothetical protein
MATKQLIRLDSNQKLTLVIAMLALVIAIWAANETRQTRLDTRRAQLRGEALAFIQEARANFNLFNCYAMVVGVDPVGKKEVKMSLDSGEDKIRADLAKMADFSDAGLTAFEGYLNQVRGRVQNNITENLVKVRGTWDKDLREKADSVCKV